MTFGPEICPLGHKFIKLKFAKWRVCCKIEGKESGLRLEALKRLGKRRKGEGSTKNGEEGTRKTEKHQPKMLCSKLGGKCIKRERG